MIPVPLDLMMYERTSILKTAFRLLCFAITIYILYIYVCMYVCIYIYIYVSSMRPRINIFKMSTTVHIYRHLALFNRSHGTSQSGIVVISGGGTGGEECPSWAALYKYGILRHKQSLFNVLLSLRISVKNHENAFTAGVLLITSYISSLYCARHTAPLLWNPGYATAEQLISSFSRSFRNRGWE
jgi:hypothetical protein